MDMIWCEDEDEDEYLWGSMRCDLKEGVSCIKQIRYNILRAFNL